MEVHGTGLTEKQQFWLDHLRRCQAGHGTIKAYAETHGLSLPSLYFWKRQLIDDGLLEGSRQVPARFKRLDLMPVSTPIAGRICLPNGVMVEWSAHGEEALQVVLRAASALT